MSWLKVDDAAADHPAVLAAGDAALGALVRLAAYSARHNLGGNVPGAAARLIATADSIERLIAVGLLDAAGDGYAVVQVPAGVMHIRSAEEVAEERAAWSARQERHRRRQREQRLAAINWDGGSGVSHGVTDGVSDPVSHSTPIPSRPVPIRSDPGPARDSEDTQSVAAGAAPRADAAGSGKGSSKGTERKRRTKAPPPHPLKDYVAALKAAAGARVTIDPFDDRLITPLTDAARAVPDPADWTAAGRRLAAGDEPGLGVVGLAWFAKSGNLATLVGKAKANAPIGRANGSGKGTAPVSTDWSKVKGGAQ